MNKQSISTKMFKSYALFFNLFISTILIIFGIYIGYEINSKIVITQENMLKSINKNIENFFEDMNEFSMSLTNSKRFKDISIHRLPAVYENNQGLNPEFGEMYQIAYKMIEKRYKVGILVNEGYYIWLGNNYFIDKSLIDKSYYNNIDKTGKQNISLIHNNVFLEDYISKYPNLGINNECTIVLSRTINTNNKLNHPEAMLEVHTPASTLKNLIDSLINIDSKEDMELYIVDNQGRPIYQNGNRDVTLEFNDGKSLKEGKFYIGDDIVDILEIPNTGLYMISIMKYNKLFYVYRKYIAMAIFSFIILNIFLLSITYKISFNISKPLKEMSEKIQGLGMDLEKGKKYTNVETNICEIVVLDQAIEEMEKKLISSFNENLKLQSLKINSRMLALQSQMQPHFLYNTLTTISVLAEENEVHKVEKICDSLTRMLRYISTESDNDITISNEIEHVDQYVKIMTERFENAEILYDIPFEMLDVVTPKLIIQPLVENSFKYNEQEKVRISINGYIENNQWIIEVIDNGKGFSIAEREKVLVYCQEVFEAHEKSELKINGMGIPNIYCRLKLLYGKDMQFDIIACENSGGHIKIGGQIKR